MDIVSIDEDYNVTLTFANERNAKIYEDLLKLYTNTIDVTTDVNDQDYGINTKGTRDEQSVLIMDAVVVDFTYIYDNWKGYAFPLQDMLKAKSSKFASTVEKQQKSKLKWYEQVVKAFLKNSEK